MAKEINLGIVELNWKPAGDTEWTLLGDTVKDENAKIVFSEEFVDYEVNEMAGAYARRSKGVIGKLTVSILLDLDLLPKLSNSYVKDDVSGEVSVFANAGGAALEGELHIHPKEKGAEKSDDIYAFRAMPKISPDINYTVEGGYAKIPIEYDLQPALDGAEKGKPCVFGRAKA